MKNISSEQVKRELIGRIDKISGDYKPQWGKMNAHEMIVHCSDQLRMSMGLKDTEYMGRPVIGSILKWYVLRGMPVPKGKIETVKELKQGVGGTKLAEFEQDRAALKELVNGFDKAFTTNKKPVHPAFGKMNYNQWGKLAFIHLNYHLNQFNM